jgi:hypothetical protein
MESENNRQARGRFPNVFSCCMLSLAFLILIAVGGTCGFLLLLDARQQEREMNCATYSSSPVSQEIVEDLCSRGLIPASVANCAAPNTQIYIGDIGTIFETNVQLNISTFHEVTNMFGDYVEICTDETIQQTIPRFSCSYDISGRGPKVRIDFNSETEVAERILVPGCGGS